MSAFIFSGDDERSYCNYCDALIVEVNKRLVCTNCGAVYDDDSVRKHREDLFPAIGKGIYKQDGPELVSMTSYSEAASGKPKKKPTQGEIEDRMWCAAGPGRSIIDAEETDYD